MELNRGLVLRYFALMPLVNLRLFLILDVSFSVYCPLPGLFAFFYLRLSHLHPFFEDQNSDVTRTFINLTEIAL